MVLLALFIWVYYSLWTIVTVRSRLPPPNRWLLSTLRPPYAATPRPMLFGLLCTSIPAHTPPLLSGGGVKYNGIHIHLSHTDVSHLHPATSLRNSVRLSRCCAGEPAQNYPRARAHAHYARGYHAWTMMTIAVGNRISLVLYNFINGKMTKSTSLIQHQTTGIYCCSHSWTSRILSKSSFRNESGRSSCRVQ